MKKVIMLFILGFISSAFFAQNKEKNIINDENVYIIDSLINQGIQDKIVSNRILTISENLTNEQKYCLYDENKKSGASPFLMNFFFGYGIGSFVQGDKIGGGIQLGLRLIGDTSNSLAMLVFYDKYIRDSYMKYSDEAVVGAWILAGVGSIFNIASFVIGCVRPWVYANNYNNDLQRVLRVKNPNWMSNKAQFAPIVDPINERYGMIAKINL